METNYDEVEDLLTIKVSDNGPGIAEEDLATLFELFASSKGSKGTGLGLPVSDKIVREHGGQIIVDSKFGLGTSFTIEIPHVKPPVVSHGLGRISGEATLTGSSIHRTSAIHESNSTKPDDSKSSR